MNSACQNASYIMKVGRVLSVPSINPVLPIAVLLTAIDDQNTPPYHELAATSCSFAAGNKAG